MGRTHLGLALIVAFSLACGGSPPEPPATPATPAPVASVAAAAQSGPIRAPATLPVVQAIEVDSFEVLDVSFSAGAAALKLVHHHFNGEGAPVRGECNYPGMQDLPSSGVTLVLWELSSQQHQDFVVYRAPEETGDCSATADNEAQLAAAKAAFTQRGLDISRKPKGLDLAQRPSVGGKVLAATTSEDFEDESGEYRRVTATLEADGQLLYEASRSYSTMMAGGESVKIVELYAEGNQGVAVYSWSTYNMRSGTQGYGLTPPLTW